MKLTDGNLAKAIREAKDNSKSKSEYIAWDDELRGFGVRVRNNKRTWIFQYKIGGRQHRIRLGGDELDCTRARLIAVSQRGKVSEAKLGHGDDPAIEREKIKAESKPQAKGKTLASLITDYLDARVGTMRVNSYGETRRHLEKHFAPLHNLALSNIQRADVAARVREIAKASGPVAANRSRVFRPCSLGQSGRGCAIKTRLWEPISKKKTDPVSGPYPMPKRRRFGWRLLRTIMGALSA